MYACGSSCCPQSDRRPSPWAKTLPNGKMMAPGQVLQFAVVAVPLLTLWLVQFLPQIWMSPRLAPQIFGYALASPKVIVPGVTALWLLSHSLRQLAGRWKIGGGYHALVWPSATSRTSESGNGCMVDPHAHTHQSCVDEGGNDHCLLTLERCPALPSAEHHCSHLRAARMREWNDPKMSGTAVGGATLLSLGFYFASERLHLLPVFAWILLPQGEVIIVVIISSSSSSSSIVISIAIITMATTIIVSTTVSYDDDDGYYYYLLLLVAVLLLALLLSLLPVVVLLVVVVVVLLVYGCFIIIIIRCSRRWARSSPGSACGS